MSIKIDLKIFLFTILFWLTKQIEPYAILMILALIHELGHLICGLTLGLKAKSMKITPFGFQIMFREYIEDFNIKVNKRKQKLHKKNYNCNSWATYKYINCNYRINYSI